MKKLLVEIRDLSYTYPGEKKSIINPFTQFIFSGEIIGLVGKNGVGKSTLIRMLAQLQTPVTGNILLNGVDSQSLNQRKEYLEQVAYVGHDNNLSNQHKIKDYCLLYSALYPNYSKADQKRILEMFELDDNSIISNLSSGNKIKAYLAFALATNSPLVLLDEVTAILDPGNREIVFSVLKQWRDKKVSIILATNLVEDLVSNADRVFYLKNRSLSEASPEKSLEVFKRKAA